MKDQSKNIRDSVIQHVALLASATDQKKYESDVPIANVPSELISGFVDDLYAPKSSVFIDAFSEEELKSLAELYGLLCSASKSSNIEELSVGEILKLPEWRSVLAYAKDLLGELT